MKLRDIKALLNTTAPDAVVLLKLRAMGGKRIGNGSQRTAYKLGDYVVKANTCAWEVNEYPDAFRQRVSIVPRKALNSRGVMAPATWYAGENRKWVIQRFYPLAADSPAGNDLYNKVLYAYWKNPIIWNVAAGVTVCLDMHDENVGVHPNGKLVAFDW
jgi:hypothetical protein